MSRRGWQVLASLGLQPAGSELDASLASFDPLLVVEQVVADLAERVWWATTTVFSG